MLFCTWRFFAFLGSVLALHYTLPRAAGKYLLLAASYCFYMSWNSKFVPLLLALTALGFTAGILWEHLPPNRRRAALIGSLVANQGLLGFFKYYNFFADNLVLLLGLQPQRFALEIMLPSASVFRRSRTCPM